MNNKELETLFDTAFKGTGNMTARGKIFRLLAGTDKPTRELAAATDAKLLAMAENYGISNLNALSEKGVKPANSEQFSEQLAQIAADIDVNEATKAARIEEPRRLAAPPGHTNPYHRSHRGPDGQFTAAARKRQIDLENWNKDVAAKIAKGAGVTLETTGS
jgi:hypothetical protein